MQSWGPHLITALSCYFVGGFPTGVIISRKKFGIDVREIGSGNIGATNVTRAFGWWAGGLVFVIDFLKGYGPLVFLSQYPDTPYLVTIGGIGLIVGHCFSPYLGFRGGKGVATSFGCVLATLPWAALWTLGAYLIGLLTSRVSAVGSLAGVSVLILYLIVSKPEFPLTLMASSIALIVIYRHRSNIVRLLGAKEKKR